MINGWVVVDKPLGVTSTRVTGRIKRLFGSKKGGHAGTLDPLATGVLAIALGEATKTMPYVADEDKSYTFDVTWGSSTTTDDLEGEVLEVNDHRPCEAEILEILPEFTGLITQTPPIYSALKVDGKRAYELARKGEIPVIKSRNVVISSLTLDACDDRKATFSVVCQKGTYVRSLGRDMALKLGTYGHISALRRTKAGPFSEKDVISLDFLEELGHKNDLKEYLLPLDCVLDDILGIDLSEEEEGRFRQGQFLKRDNLEEGQTVLCRKGGTPVGLGLSVEGQLRPQRVFNL